jgi:potassium efflux system protein
LPETIRAEVVGLYKQAVNQLAVADNWAKQVAKYQSGREQAPALLAVVKQRIEEAASQPATGPSSKISSDTSLEELNSRLLQARAELKNRQGEAQKLDDEANTRLQRKALIPDLLGAAKQRLEKTVADLSASSVPGITPQLAQARRSLLMAQKQAVEQEIAAHGEELRFYDARTDLLAARRDEAKRLVSPAQTQVTALEALVSDRRKMELEQQRQQAELDLRTVPQVVRELAEGNAKLLKEREAIDEQIDRLETKTKTVTNVTVRLTREFEFLQKNIDQDEGADLGPLMRMSRDELAGLRGYEADLRANKKKYAGVRLQAWEMEEEWLIPVNTRVQQIMEQLRDSKQQLNLARLEPRVRELAESRRTSLEQSKKFFGTYELRLRELIAAEDALAAKVREFRDFIEGHVFSVRSANPIHKTALPREWYSVKKACVALAGNLLTDVRNHFPVYLLAVTVIILLLASTPSLRRRLHDLSPRVAKVYTDSYRLTLIAFFCTSLMSVTSAALLWFAARRVTLGAGTPEGDAFGVGQAIATGLRSAMWIMLILAFVRNVCRPKGLADVHFRWDSSAVRLVRINLLWLTPTLPLAWFLVSATERYLDSAWQESLGRLAFVVAMLSVAVCTHRLLRPAGRLVAVQFRKRRSEWLYGLRYFWYAGGTLVPLALITVSLFGYHYTAVVLAE